MARYVQDCTDGFLRWRHRKDGVRLRLEALQVWHKAIDGGRRDVRPVSWRTSSRTSCKAGVRRCGGGRSKTGTTNPAQGRDSRRPGSLGGQWSFESGQGRSAARSRTRGGNQPLRNITPRPSSEQHRRQVASAGNQHRTRIRAKDKTQSADTLTPHRDHRERSVGSMRSRGDDSSGTPCRTASPSSWMVEWLRRCSASWWRATRRRATTIPRPSSSARRPTLPSARSVRQSTARTSPASWPLRCRPFGAAWGVVASTS